MDKEKNVAQVEEREFTEEQTKTQLRMFEGDFIKGLIAAADYKTEETQRIEIIRNGVLFFAFNIRALGEEEYNKCKTKHTKYVRNKQLGIKLPEDTNTVKFYRIGIFRQLNSELFIADILCVLRFTLVVLFFSKRPDVKCKEQHSISDNFDTLSFLCLIICGSDQSFDKIALKHTQLRFGLLLSKLSFFHLSYILFLIHSVVLLI